MEHLKHIFSLESIVYDTPKTKYKYIEVRALVMKMNAIKYL